MREYITFDRQLDALASLREFCLCAERASTDEKSWKYAIVAIHNALQGYICIALANGNGFQTWSERDMQKWLNAYRNETSLPNTKLDFFMDLYDKIFSDEGSLDRKNISWLNDTRNSLIHFNVDSFGVHRDSAITCCGEALSAIELCPSKATGIFFYSEEQLQDFKKTIKDAETALDTHTRKT